jgi:glyoxylase-like metal-dependent hydrolase (beta-lactamase superfamily II)
VTASSTDWAETGPEKVADGIYRIPLPLPSDSLRAVNVYAMLTHQGITMIDGGWALADSENALSAALGQIGMGMEDIRRFLVTHCHRDHYTQAIAIRRKFGPEVAIGIGEKPNLTQVISDASRARRPTSARAAILRRAGAIALAHDFERTTGQSSYAAEWELPDRWLDSGAQLEAGDWVLRVIETPGHTRGHVVYHEESSHLLFAGDHVLPRITPSIGYEPTQARHPLRDYLSSLELMLTLPDALLLPAHGPVAPSVHARVAELLDHHSQRLADACSAVGRGAGTGLEVAQRLTWTRHERSLGELSISSQVMAVMETMAHLDVLALQGRLKSAANPGAIVRFQPARDTTAGTEPAPGPNP